MRLIDADELKKTYQKWIPQLSSKEDEGDKRGVETCIAVLEDAPTINPEDLRPKGKWEDGSCTNCKFDLGCLVDGESELYQWVWTELDYCPHCGAKMKEDNR